MGRLQNKMVEILIIFCHDNNDLINLIKEEEKEKLQTKYFTYIIIV